MDFLKKKFIIIIFLYFFDIHKINLGRMYVLIGSFEKRKQTIFFFRLCVTLTSFKILIMHFTLMLHII